MPSIIVHLGIVRPCCNPLNLIGQMRSVFDGTIIARTFGKRHESFKTVFASIDASEFLPSEKLLFKNGEKDHPLNVSLDTEMYAIYHLLYRHRNRCAHNTPSYQLNIPTLNELSDEAYQKYNNIFHFFATLLLIDEVFRTSFAHYQELCSEL